MNMIRNDLTIGFDGIDFDLLLSNWRWLIHKDMSPLIISAFGDIFLCRQDGHVFWLDTGGGNFTEVAETIEKFKKMLFDMKQVEIWFLSPLIDALKLLGKALKPKQCYSFTIPPFLGGKYEPENIEPIDIYAHFSLFGQLLYQCKDLPDGTKIKIQITE